MFHVLTLDIPWNHVEHDYTVHQNILNGEVIPRPDSKPDATDVRWMEIQRCCSPKASARPSALAMVVFLRSELGALTNNDISIRGLEENHRYASPDALGAEQTTASDSDAHSIQRGLNGRTQHHQGLASSDVITLHPPPLNVLIVGETGVGKSSIIDLIMGQNVTDMPGASLSMLKHTTYEINLEGRRFKLWEVSSLASMGFLRRIYAKWQLKKSYKKLYEGSGVFLLLYCMRASRIPAALPRDYKCFTSIVGPTSGVPIFAVINGLEGSLNTMDDWWTEKQQALGHLGMHFSKHACITSLPDNLDTLRSYEAIRSLICDNLS